MPKRIVTRLTQLYGVDYPIAQAPMAFVGTEPGLAIAVCKAGGIGSIAAGPLPAEAVRALIRAVRQQTDRPLNVNFITFLAQPEQIQVCIEEKIPVVSFHWGHPPREFIQELQGAGSRVWEQVGSVESALEAVDSGVDLIVAQGSEAGGHNYGVLPLFVQLPSILEAVGPTPVLAAGGISTGRQLAAALALGADGVSIGTRFIAAAESFAHPQYKRRLIEASSVQTRLTSVYGPDMPHFNPMRVLDVGLAREYAGREHSAPRDLASQPVIATMKLAGEEVPLRRFTAFVPTPETEGKIDEMPYLAGQGVGLVKDVQPVGTIMQSMMAEACQALESIQPQPEAGQKAPSC